MDPCKQVKNINNERRSSKSNISLHDLFRSSIWLLGCLRALGTARFASFVSDLMGCRPALQLAPVSQWRNRRGNAIHRSARGTSPHEIYRTGLLTYHGETSLPCSLKRVWVTRVLHPDVARNCEQCPTSTFGSCSWACTLFELLANIDKALQASSSDLTHPASSKIG